jgi:hypothetical protein
MVSADITNGSELHVLEGVVIASSLKQPSAERKTGALHVVRVNREGSMESVAFRRNSITSSLRQVVPLRRAKIANTGVGFKVGDKDPRWSIIAGDSEFGPYPQPATYACLLKNTAKTSGAFSMDFG